ncbi:hypothetical protein A2U01_0097396, partial [Trifolium medium]|nr:hypothetical protein [Trifolium medium]
MNNVVWTAQSFCVVVAVSDCLCRHSSVAILSNVSVSPWSNRLHR